MKQRVHALYIKDGSVVSVCKAHQDKTGGGGSSRALRAFCAARTASRSAMAPDVLAHTRVNSPCSTQCARRAAPIRIRRSVVVAAGRLSRARSRGDFLHMIVYRTSTQGTCVHTILDLVLDPVHVLVLLVQFVY